MLIVEYYLFTTLLCILLAGLWGFTRKISMKRRLLPPGPGALSITRNVINLWRRPQKQMARWAMQYGPIYKMKMGLADAVVLTNHKLIKELFTDIVSTGRLVNNPVVREFAKGPHGLINSEGPTWEAQRRFTLKSLRPVYTIKNLCDPDMISGFYARILKDFGFSNKTSMEALIMEEVCSMLRWFYIRSGKPILGNRIFNAPVVNSLWCLVSGERCEWEMKRPKILDVATALWETFLEVNYKGVTYAPVLRYIFPKQTGWNRYMAAIDDMSLVIRDSIHRHEETFDPANLRDFIDHFLMEMKKAKDLNSSFSNENGYKNLVATVIDLFVAGSETSSNTLSWMFLYVSNHPKVQHQLHEEIDLVLGTRTPSLQDRPSMPYTEAVISETLRIAPVVSLGAPHRMVADKMFHGYLLPADIAVFGNVYGVHHDPNVWGDPNNFRPERFLSDDGTTFVRHDALIPFSEGKRKCIGDTISKDTLFLFTASVFQHFQVLSSREDNVRPDFEPDEGIFLVPKPFTVTMLSRN